ncbi:MAG: Hsp20/alpha crystallin family protein [Paludibacter sp.]|nr:Hsp20/alpha crystallin family protein [Paludibacter sp.]MDD4198686.1 Hsp20/alpha crystallin family protein [Paludibacter sp.]MDD4427104.1 Hsp20/alpha crystallin family protein [Paludibacter sp.]
MSLVRFKRNYPSLFDHFFENDLFDWSNRNFSATNTTLPSVNIKEGKENFEVEVAAPGLSKEDFKIELNNSLLTLSSEKKVENEEKNGECYTCREFSYQSFSRSFTLPNIADGEKVVAKYDNGILTVTIPKKEEAKAKPSRIIEIM